MWKVICKKVASGLILLNLYLKINYFPTSNYLNNEWCKREDIQKMYEEFSAQGYDIFNINDKFYTDICTPFTSSHDTDMSLSDRINYIYNSLDLQCQPGCKFSGINKETLMNSWRIQY